MSADGPRALLRERRIVVVVGSGGVGKTTLAAALALEGARLGRRALVLTIDPARRLADALGVGAIGNQPVAIPRETLRACDVPEDGALFAVMLDMKRTFDDLVQRFAESDEARDHILANPIYQHVSDALAGSAEYAAMEKVYELAERDEHDLLVLDTPPSQHALDFLDAPARLLDFLDSRVVQLLLHPAFAAGRFGFRVFQRGTRRVLQVMERVSGVGFLQDISDFLLAFEGMSQGFRARARRVRAVLTGSETAFVLAAGTGSETVDHAVQLLERLREAHVSVAGMIANRVRTWPEPGGPPDAIVAEGERERATAQLARALAASQGEGFPARAAAQAALAAAEHYALLVRCDARATEQLFAKVDRNTCFCRRVPELPRDVHDLDGLGHVARALFGDADGKEADAG